MHRDVRVPAAVYRLQLHRGFGFDDARALVPYLHLLGVTDCYVSPILRASPGSTHGYDICDHGELNPELGPPEAFDRFAEALRAHDMGLLLDFVPNHMSADPNWNPWWRDVLRHGEGGAYAGFFDIDWEPVKPALRGKVLLPVLGDQYGAVLERGELQLRLEHGALSVRYFDFDVPLDPRELPPLLEQAIDAIRATLGEDHPDLREYLSICTALRHLPPREVHDADSVTERERESAVARERLARLLATSTTVRTALEAAVRRCNGEPGNPDSFDCLHRLLEAQPYRLAFWRTALHEINYRRFFDVNSLAGLRMDDPAVFEATHALLRRLVAARQVTGVRLDHVDGLYDPAQYLERLSTALGPEPPYLVVEKILGADETLPGGWPVAGTTGYEFLNETANLFVDDRHARALLRTYRRFTGRRQTAAEVVAESKRHITETSMAGELNVLAQELSRLAESDRRTRDFTLLALREALREVIVAFPVYRSYVTAAGASDADRRAIETALRTARRRQPAVERSVFDFLRTVLLPEPGRSAHLRFAMRVQQYTAPVHAKGVEDTAFYRHVPLASANEVGAELGRVGHAVASFHAANARRADRRPHTLLASSTHDTKRGEDARARGHVLSELPEAWSPLVSAWARIHAVHRTDVDGVPAPSRNDEYLFYQTLVAAWPPGARAADDALVDRLRAYAKKAAREAKLQTSWIAENPAYEAALDRFIDGVLRGPTAERFLASFVPFADRVARIGMVNALAQLVAKATSPGVPDFYQGSELWTLTLTDPDNRRPVDFATRRRLLEDLGPLLAADGDRSDGVARLLAEWPDGRIKLFLTALACRLRARHRAISDGGYEPLLVRGERSGHVVAYARLHDGDGVGVVAVLPRLVAALMGDGAALPVGAGCWRDARLVLPDAWDGLAFRDVITGVVHRAAPVHDETVLGLATVLEHSPVAILEFRRPAAHAAAAAELRAP